MAQLQMCQFTEAEIKHKVYQKWTNFSYHFSENSKTHPWFFQKGSISGAVSFQKILKIHENLDSPQIIQICIIISKHAEVQ